MSPEWIALAISVIALVLSGFQSFWRWRERGESAPKLVVSAQEWYGSGTGAGQALLLQGIEVIGYNPSTSNATITAVGVEALGVDAPLLWNTQRVTIGPRQAVHLNLGPQVLSDLFADVDRDEGRSWYRVYIDGLGKRGKRATWYSEPAKVDRDALPE